MYYCAQLVSVMRIRPSVTALKSLITSCSGYSKGVRSPAVSAMIAHAAAPLIVCATAAWTGLLNPSGVSDADGFLLLCGDEQCITTCASAVIVSLQCFASEPVTTLGCISDATLLLGAVAKHHIAVRVDTLFSCMPISHSAFFFRARCLLCGA